MVILFLFVLIGPVLTCSTPQKEVAKTVIQRVAMEPPQKNCCRICHCLTLELLSSKGHLAVLTSEVIAACSTGSDAAAKTRRCLNTQGHENCPPEGYDPTSQNTNRMKHSMLDVTRFNAGCASRRGVHKLTVRSS